MWLLKILSAATLGACIGVTAMTANLYLGPLHAWAMAVFGTVALVIAFIPRP